MRMLLAILACLVWAGPALARTFENCSRPQVKVADAAIGGAREIAVRAAAAVADTPEFVLWFGAFSAPHGERVRASLKAIHAALVEDDLKAVCLGGRAFDCKDGTFAFVLFDRPRTIHLCPDFFRMPAMEDARAGRGALGNGTREGTILHELSHFPFVAGTRDDCYGRGPCGDLAGRDPSRAIATADSYQYFAEDVTLAFWAVASLAALPRGPRPPLAADPGDR